MVRGEHQGCIGYSLGSCAALRGSAALCPRRSLSDKRQRALVHFLVYPDQAGHPARRTHGEARRYSLWHGQRKGKRPTTTTVGMRDASTQREGGSGTGTHGEATARSVHAHRPQCAAASWTSGAYAAGRYLVSGLRLLCVTSRLTRPFYFLFQLCDSMGSTTANHNKPNVYGQQQVGRIAPPWRDVRLTGSLWWLPIICFHQGGTAMNLKYRITARTLLLYSSLSPVVDNLKSKSETRSKVSLYS